MVHVGLYKAFNFLFTKDYINIINYIIKKNIIKLSLMSHQGVILTAKMFTLFIN